MANINALLWKLTIDTEADKPPSSGVYLFGTMHSAVQEAVIKIPQVLEHLDTCSHYFGETNLDSTLFEPQSISISSSTWKGLRNVMSINAYAKAAKLLHRLSGFHLKDIDHLPPLFQTALISERILNPGKTLSPLDFQLWSYAKQSGLILGAMESPEEQARIYQSIPMDYQIRELKAMVTHLSKATNKLKKLTAAYSAEDLNGLMRLTGPSLGTVRRLLLYDRNGKMASKILTILQQSQNTFIALGAAHLPGPKGILSYLKRMGVSLQPISLIQ